MGDSEPWRGLHKNWANILSAQSLAIFTPDASVALHKIGEKEEIDFAADTR